MRKVEFDHVFSSHTTIPVDVYTELGKARGKQIFVHQIWRPLFATTLSQFQFNDMILEISYINQQGDMEKDKITVTGKSLHSLLCARNGASKVSYLYDGTNIKQNQNLSDLNINESSQMVSITCETQNGTNMTPNLQQNNISHISQNSLLLNNGMVHSNNAGTIFPDMNFYPGCTIIIMDLISR